MPERDKKDLYKDIPEALRKLIQFIFAMNIEDVFSNTLQPSDTIHNVPSNA